MFRKIGGFVFIVTMAATLGTTAAGAQAGIPFCALDPGISRLSTANFVATGCNYFAFNQPAHLAALAAARSRAISGCGAPLTSRARGPATCAAQGATFKTPGIPSIIGSNINGGPAEGVVSVNAAAGHCAVTAVMQSAITQPGSQTCGTFFFKFAPYRMTQKGEAACGYVCQR